MTPNRKRTTSVIVGILSAMIILMLMESLSSKLFPLPEGIDVKNPQEIIKAINSMPMSAFLLQLFSYFIAAFVGGLVATKISEGVTKYPQLIVVSIFALMSLVNSVSLGEPIWFTIASVMIPFPAGYLGFMVMGKR